MDQKSIFRKAVERPKIFLKDEEWGRKRHNGSKNLGAY